MFIFKIRFNYFCTPELDTPQSNKYENSWRIKTLKNQNLELALSEIQPVRLKKNIRPEMVSTDPGILTLLLNSTTHLTLMHTHTPQRPFHVRAGSNGVADFNVKCGGERKETTCWFRCLPPFLLRLERYCAAVGCGSRSMHALSKKIHVRYVHILWPNKPSKQANKQRRHSQAHFFFACEFCRKMWSAVAMYDDW